jgi:DNA/RNA-binding domain of Phe-tRNA-synthetase-like protein
VDGELAAEFPGLGLEWIALDRGSGPSSPDLKERLRHLSDRFTGGKAVQLRQQPVPWAYRVFSRQVGIDPDERPTPVEALALDRLKRGGFRSRNLLDDAITLATMETGVPLVALDGDRVEGEPWLRLAAHGELLGGAGRPLSARQIVIADAIRPLAVVLGDVDPERGVTPTTRRMLLCALRVAGVPEVSVEEALWIAEEALSAPAAGP